MPNPTAADMLSEALDAHLAAYRERRGPTTELRLAQACRQHLPALLAEYAQLRELAKAAVAYRDAYSKCVESLEAPNLRPVLELHELQASRRDELWSLIDAYRTAHPEGAAS